MRLVDCWEEAVKEQIVLEQSLIKVAGSQPVVTSFSLLLPVVVYFGSRANGLYFRALKPVFITTRRHYDCDPYVYHMNWPTSLTEVQKQALKRGQIIIAFSLRFSTMIRLFGQAGSMAFWIYW